MPTVHMTKEEVQALIAFNKRIINYWEQEQSSYKEMINRCWEGSNPLSNSVDSQTAFSCLNIYKDELRKIKKKIKLLASVQSALKISIR